MAAPPLSREDFLREMEMQATKLKRFIRELREGEWEKFDIKESVTPVGPEEYRGGQRPEAAQERLTIVINASRLQKLGTGVDRARR